jgi:hypothetical protein
MQQWEYQKLDLNNVPRKSDDVDLLNDAGKNGWVLVDITPHKIAYMKREVPPPTKAAKAKS